MDAVHEVYSLLLSRSMRVSFAESCTGGLLSSRLVDIPGASNVFDESYVTYSNESKRRLLGVKSETLQKHGAVSEECALEMALGALKASGADYALSVTGMVYIGVADKRGAEAMRCMFDGDRGQIRRAAADEAYALLLRRMRGKELN